MIGLGFVGDPEEGLRIARELVAHPDVVVVRSCRFSATEFGEFKRVVMQSMPPAPPGTTILGYMTDGRAGKVTAG
jgi:hypothetical protein